MALHLYSICPSIAYHVDGRDIVGLDVPRGFPYCHSYVRGTDICLGSEQLFIHQIGDHIHDPIEFRQQLAAAACIGSCSLVLCVYWYV